MCRTAFVFPGQGAQFVGMGKDFFENFSIARETFENGDDALNCNLSSICFEGDDDELAMTTNAQPAILMTSIAILNVMKAEGFSSEFTAGLSLGEYSSLVHAESIEMNQAINLVRNRGSYMQKAVPVGIGKMAAIVGIEMDRVQGLLEICKKKGVIEIANYNTFEQIVLSGEAEPIKEAIKLAKQFGAKKALPIPVSGPFHCSLLKPARD